MLCMRVAEGGRPYTLRDGSVGYIHRQGAPPGLAAPLSAPAPGAPPPERADVRMLDAVYSALLAALDLSPAHREALRRRGLSDHEIGRRGYRSLPLRGRAALARRLSEQWPPERLLRVPGFWSAGPGWDGRRWLTLGGPPGLVVPVRDGEGRISALIVRRDDGTDGPRYCAVSSAPHGGPSPGARLHVPLRAEGADDRAGMVRITEGVLKADVATALSGVLTLGMPGIGAVNTAIPYIHTHKPHITLFAPDSDWRTNDAVRRHTLRGLAHLAVAVDEYAGEFHVETWDSAYKGIDDALAAGAEIKTTRVTRADIERFIARRRAS